MSCTNPSKHDTLNNVGVMLGQRRRRWTNIRPTLSQCVVFAGIDWWPHVSMTASYSVWPSILYSHSALRVYVNLQPHHHYIVNFLCFIWKHRKNVQMVLVTQHHNVILVSICMCQFLACAYYSATQYCSITIETPHRICPENFPCEDSWSPKYLELDPWKD